MKFIKYFEWKNFKNGDSVYVIDKNYLHNGLELNKKYTIRNKVSNSVFIIELNDYFLEDRFVSEDEYWNIKGEIYNL